ncbi:SMI1/KNR4 family protein [Dyella sp. GSA-30]|uniref:SMI1/KNR4 family protein n=1 Tax=Dyella sp. GSA-30 TaxID=2994496 RepID=UPI00248F86F3|nr:SMI1/KNR4 family protein [Dyella sp. GSA-30]
MDNELISRLDQCLVTLRPDYHAGLRPGVSEADLAAFESQFSLKLPMMFRQLYQWRDGQDLQSFEALQFNRMWMTLADIAEVKDMMDGMIGYDFEDPRYWRRGWVPFLGNGGGSYLCLDLAAEDGGQPGQILEFWKADEDRPIVWADMQAWLGDLVRSMEGGTLEIY